MVGGARRRVVVGVTSAEAAGNATPRTRGRATTKAIIYACVGVTLLIPGGSVLFYLAERGHNDQVRNIGSAFRWTLLTLLEDQPAFDAKTDGGTILTYVMLLSGLVFIAIATASLATRMVQALMRPDVKRVRKRVHGHIVICGWSDKGNDIVRELRLQHVERRIVVLAPLEHAPSDDPSIVFVKGHPTHEDDLLRAGLDRADTAIVLADTSDPTDDADDIDGHSLLTTLAIETIRPEVYTCVEVLRARNRRHFERANADELIVSDEMTGAMIANSAVTHGLAMVITDLLTHGYGTELAELSPPPSAIGMAFADAVGEVKRAADAVLVAVAGPAQPFELNPPGDREIRSDDRLLVISPGNSKR